MPTTAQTRGPIPGSCIGQWLKGDGRAQLQHHRRRHQTPVSGLLSGRYPRTGFSGSLPANPACFWRSAIAGWDTYALWEGGKGYFASQDKNHIIIAKAISKTFSVMGDPQPNDQPCLLKMQQAVREETRLARHKSRVPERCRICDFATSNSTASQSSNPRGTRTTTRPGDC